MEGTCFLCYYRIHGGQAAVLLRVGDRWRLVHRHHESEGLITVTRIRHNIVDEVVEGGVRHNIVNEVVEERATFL